MVPPKQGSTHQMSAYYSICRPRKDERLSWPSWSTYSGRFVHISGHLSATGQAQDRKVRRGITDVLPLCYATKIVLHNQHIHISYTSQLKLNIFCKLYHFHNAQNVFIRSVLPFCKLYQPAIVETQLLQLIQTDVTTRL